MDTNREYDPKSFWDSKARRAGEDFESAVGLDDPNANKIIDRVQKRYIRLAFRQMGRPMDLRGRKILDYGCGTGRWVDFFRGLGMEYTGVDLSPEMVRIASARFPDVYFASLLGEGLPFPSRTFDVVCSIAVIHHNRYEEQASILRELSRVIKPDGFLVLFESIGPLNPESAVEFPRPTADWQKTLQDLGLEQLWSRQTRYFATRTIMNKVVGENRLPILTQKAGLYLDPYLGGFLPGRLRTRGVMVFKKFAE